MPPVAVASFGASSSRSRWHVWQCPLHVGLQEWIFSHHGCVLSCRWSRRLGRSYSRCDGGELAHEGLHLGHHSRHFVVPPFEFFLKGGDPLFHWARWRGISSIPITYFGHHYGHRLYRCESRNKARTPWLLLKVGGGCRRDWRLHPEGVTFQICSALQVLVALSILPCLEQCPLSWIVSRGLAFLVDLGPSLLRGLAAFLSLSRKLAGDLFLFLCLSRIWGSLRLSWSLSGIKVHNIHSLVTPLILLIQS